MKAFYKKAATYMVAILTVQSLILAATAGSVSAGSVKSQIKEVKKYIRHYKKVDRDVLRKKKRFLKKVAEVKSTLSIIQSDNLNNDLNIQFLKDTITVYKLKTKLATKKHKKIKKNLAKLGRQLHKLVSLNKAKVMIGEASWYGGGIREYKMCAAMRGFRGKKVRVTNLNNGRKVTVIINDYGPATWTGRKIDLSKAAFARIGALSAGVMRRVKVEVF